MPGEFDLAEFLERKRRVARACDECRKRKIKCNGVSPCINCTANGSVCTFNETGGRKKSRHVEELEAKLRYAQKVIDVLKPGMDIFDPSFRLDKLQKQVEELPATEITPPPAPAKRFDSNIRVPLPPKAVAQKLLDKVYTDACVLFLCFHRGDFGKILDFIYDTPTADYNELHYDMLPLVYSILAVGVLFSSRTECEQLGFSDSSEGYRYFEEAQRRTPLTEVHNVYAVLTIVMMTLFLQCSARLSTCYTYIGIAMRSALRLGLHRKIMHHNYNPVELETRKRLFFTIRKMDTYINAMLGLPRTIADEDFDQEMPSELEDKYITEEGYMAMPYEVTSSAKVANCHTRLIAILAKIMNTIYAVRPDADQAARGKSRVAQIYSQVERIELELANWRSSLPKELEIDASEVDPAYLKANRYLGLCHCYVQTLLYRPFIHYCSPSCGNVTGNTLKAKMFALKCITVARQAVFQANQLVQSDQLNGSYYFTTYAIFFAVSCLMYYVSENETDANAYEIFLDAQSGRYALKTIRESSVSAARVYKLLEVMFKQLDQKTSVWKEKLAEEEDSFTPESDQYLPPTNGFSVLSFDQLGVVPKPVKLEEGANGGSESTSAASAAGDDSSPPSSDLRPVTQPKQPGLMDQFDQQLFGRFVPPHMMPLSYFGNGGNDLIEPMELTALDQNNQSEALLNVGGDIFNDKVWESFLSQHEELSGMNI
uniref:ARAD1D43956p n=1 Tax=Blastobotrys adeninivorans TaxID=409370 RepID=A0A060TCM4_BLAAD